MKEVMKLLIAFAPWLAFLLLAGHSFVRLEIALVVAALLTVVMAVTKIHRGAIIWAGYLFFGTALLMVIGLKNMWFIQHIGLLANGSLLLFTLIGMLLGKPFTEEYAKAEVTAEAAASPEFVRKSYIVTTLWMIIFLLNFLSDGLAGIMPEIQPWIIKSLHYSLLLGGVLGTRVLVYFWKIKQAKTRLGSAL